MTMTSLRRATMGRKPVVIEASELDMRRLVETGDTVLWGQAMAEPTPLTQALRDQRHRIGRFNAFLGMSFCGTFSPEHTDCISFASYCGTGNNSALARAGKLDILACHYSQLPELIRSGRLRVDVLMLQVAASPNGEEYSLSIAHEYLVAALEVARVVVAEVNEQAPWSCGHRTVRSHEIDFVVRSSRAPQEIQRRQPGVVDMAIARNVAGLIGDRSTLQLGIGVIPETVLSQLTDRKDLGIHSGAFGDGLVDLIERGVVTNAAKGRDTGVSVAGMILGTKRAYDFVHRNPKIQFHATDYIHDPTVLASLERLVAINSATEVDLTGQINAESVNGAYIGTVGGAVDFLRGAARSRGGLPIVALPATAGSISRIVGKLGGPVSTPRSDAGVIVTEHGVADLRGKTLSARIELMLGLAHPNHRDALEKQIDGIAGRKGKE